MAQEEKAKAYNELVGKIKKAYLYAQTDSTKAVLEDILPELRESEDERIRKEIVRFIQMEVEDEIVGNEWIAWLKKQVSPQMVADAYLRGCNDTEKKWLKKQCEQKPQGESAREAAQEKKVDNQNCVKTANKVEQKFKVGDWIVNNQTSNIYLVKEVKDDEYCLWPLDGIIEGYLRIIDVDTEYHLWTIEDAKDGNVLSDGTTIFIFKDLLSDGSVMSYCDYDTNSGESDAFCPLSVNLICSKITPVTKEQRDLLFQKMKEEGYEWDANKKELKKIEQKPVEPKWSKEDDEYLQDAINYFNLDAALQHSTKDFMIFLRENQPF